VRFNVEARRRYLTFAMSPEARWAGNFRELTASVTRMATLADAGRITEDNVREEIGRLRATWSNDGSDDDVARVMGDRAIELDLFDRCQLNAVIGVCRNAGNLSEAGRALFAFSRREKKQANDADRLRKYLARFGLEFDSLRTRTG
jgi:transcriptional regulatory protein RtcR